MTAETHVFSEQDLQFTNSFINDFFYGDGDPPIEEMRYINAHPMLHTFLTDINKKVFNVYELSAEIDLNNVPAFQKVAGIANTVLMTMQKSVQEQRDAYDDEYSVVLYNFKELNKICDELLKLKQSS